MAQPFREPDPRDAQRVVTQNQADNQSIGQIINGLIGDAQLLVQRQVDLARTEIKLEIDKAKQAALSLGIGIGVTAVGGMLLILMLVHGLNTWFDMPLWVAYLIVGVIFTALGGFLLYTGANRVKQLDPMPRETIESVKENVETVAAVANPDRTL